ncbi:MAG TPA: hypothetical protein VHY37_00935 [Tepidisphaeraceae bacterium]|jgi:hypothetical protein|nr:hypothetical protein [Tepidisphaeraceae bacterium]
MGVYEGRGQLGKSIKLLLRRWEEAKSDWDDSVSKNFEKTYLLPMELDLRNAVGAMDHMAQVLAQVRRDCS